MGIEPAGCSGRPEAKLVATFSIVGFDPATGDLGVAVQSKFFGVGSVVPWAKANVGAIATQSYANVDYGPEGLALLSSGCTPRQTLDRLTEADPDRDRRQVGIVDAQGRVAAFTGTGCHAWAGHLEADNFAVQGNILAGEQVVQAMASAFRQARQSEGSELADWLMAALVAGQAAGGDTRGQQSAALLVVREKGGFDRRNDRYIDLRVEDHPRPIDELARLLVIHKEFFQAAHRSGLSAADLSFLADLTQAVVAECRVPAGSRVAGVGPNKTGDTLIRPGGRAAYPAFWIRDYALALDAGYFTLAEQKHALLITARHQVDKTKTLPTGSVLLPGSIPDHISFGGVPIFFPGNLEDYAAQGGERWGRYPCLDDAFFFIHMAKVYAGESGSAEFLRQKVNGKPLIQRLEEAYRMPPSRPGTGLVFATENARGINFGFFDTTYHTGDLFFCSVLKYRAALELAGLFEALNDDDRARAYRLESETLRQALTRVFARDDGFFSASTGLSAQPDVWGTAFAVYVGAIRGEQARQASEALARACNDATAVAWRGNIRQVPTWADSSETTMWEATTVAKNRYQNGAYWGTPVGWVCYAVAQVDPDAARTLAQAYISELREGDFRKGPEFGSPWECMHWEDQHRQNPVYLTSVACPLSAFRRISGWN